jgi:hypothetical protein
MEQRFISELREFEKDQTNNLVDSLLPRQSGSLEWRSSRAEMGSKDVMSMMAGYSDIEKASQI